MILFTPVDIDLNIDKKEIIDGLRPDGKFHVWNMEKLTQQNNGKYGKNEYTDNAKSKYPKLISSIRKLPFDAISNVKINYQTTEPVLHVDFQGKHDGAELIDNIRGNEPSGYRILIKGSRSTLVIHDGIKECDTYMPPDTDTYMLDQSSAFHTVKRDPGRIIVYITAYVNPKKHQALLEKSIKKYADYVIRAQ